MKPMKRERTREGREKQGSWKASPGNEKDVVVKKGKSDQL